ncbi:Major facilitator superfamily domain-containing protein 10 [Talaromyces islandicus]|uniref:Major facilitator superfamily domain-containing protein 10 n=1 Tax=Talaromyces islandicus TaxID=28573 RepID=A0A0U1LJL7_TALIS|nr:Major facilitator superfamily domain-containing protein 10 [Talaromyces islandicus]
MAAASEAPSIAGTASQVQRKKVLRVIFISLLLDLISFTFILPLFPSLLDFYLKRDPSPDSLLNRIFHYLHAYKNAFAKPIDSRYDIVLLGGALGSLFSFLQALAAPVIGGISDKHGRRTALLWSMTGNIISVALWVAATDFRTFLASRVVGGLSEGNVQMANAIATDISDESQRGSTMAMVGACFSIAFTFGPALGAALANVTFIAANPFATAAGVSLFLIVAETLYLYRSLPETHPKFTKSANSAAAAAASGSKTGNKASEKTSTNSGKRTHTNNPMLLNAVHLLFLLPFSGMEFSLPFLATTLLGEDSTTSPSALNGRVLGIVGLIASLLQGTMVRRLSPLLTVRIGIVSCAIAFFLLARVSTVGGLQFAACFLAVTSATVVTGLNSLGSLEAGDGERGIILGRLRSWGQFGRALGPLIFCSFFWWAGREVAFTTGGVAMLGVCGIVFAGLKAPAVGQASK